MIEDDKSSKDNKSLELIDPELPESRNVPTGAKFLKQTVETIDGLLVCTGCYNPDVTPDVEGDEKNYQGHRDFPRITELYKPTKIFHDVNDCMDFVFETEQYCG